MLAGSVASAEIAHTFSNVAQLGEWCGGAVSGGEGALWGKAGGGSLFNPS